MLFRFFYFRVNIIFHITMDAEERRSHIVITRVYRNTVVKKAVITTVLTEDKYERCK